MSGITVRQWVAQNAYHNVKIMKFNSIVYVAVV